MTVDKNNRKSEYKEQLKWLKLHKNLETGEISIKPNEAMSYFQPRINCYLESLKDLNPEEEALVRIALNKNDQALNFNEILNEILQEKVNETQRKEDEDRKVRALNNMFLEDGGVW